MTGFKKESQLVLQTKISRTEVEDYLKDKYDIMRGKELEVEVKKNFKALKHFEDKFKILETNF